MPTGARGIGYPRVWIRGGCELTSVLGPLLQAHEAGWRYIYKIFFIDRGDSSVIWRRTNGEDCFSLGNNLSTVRTLFKM